MFSVKWDGVEMVYRANKFFLLQSNKVNTAKLLFSPQYITQI